MSIKLKFFTRSIALSCMMLFAVSGYAGVFSGWGNYDPYYGQCNAKCKRTYVKTLDRCSRVARLDNCGWVKSNLTADRPCGKYKCKYAKNKYKKCAYKMRYNNNYYWSWF